MAELGERISGPSLDTGTWMICVESRLKLKIRNIVGVGSLMVGWAIAVPGAATERLWPSTPPADCPFPPSTEITGVAFTGEFTN